MELSSGGGVSGAVANVGNGAPAAQNARVAVQDLFNLYLGRSTTSKSDAISREQQSSKLRRKMSATNRPQPPKDENFLADYQELQTMFADAEQLRSSTEAVLAMLVVQCSYHSLQVEFLLSALQTLTKLNLIRWDTFLPLLLRAVSACETAGLQQAPPATSTPASVASHMLGNSTTPPLSAPASPAPPLSSSLIASPTHSAVDTSSNILPSNTATGSTNGSGGKIVSGPRVVTWLRPLVCKILQAALEAELKPVACYDVLVQIVSWINQWDLRSATAGERPSVNKDDGRVESTAWLHDCVELIWALIDEGKCRVPFYALLHDRSQLKIEHWPEDELLFALFLEVHRRRDKISLHIQMLDHHLHCPTFATLRMTALTYVGSLGEPLHGEDVANAIPRGSLEWERALRCLRHALRFNPSADWWKKVLLSAPRYRQQTQGQAAPPRAALISLTQPASEFSADMTCEAVVDRIMELMTPINAASSSAYVSMTEAGRWQEWLIFADLFYFFMRSGYIDFLEFIDRLAARFARGDQPVMRSNHVTWLLAQVFRLETVTAALSSDSKKLETAQKILSFHMAERPVDQTTNLAPQTMLLDFVGSSQILRLWSINRAMMEQLTGNRMPEHIQKGKQIDEWWKQVLKGERVLDYSNLDDKSMGMVWVLSHTVSQPICEAVMAWLNSKGAADYMSPGQTGDRLAIIHETRPLPIVLLSGLSLHMSSRLINNIEEVMFPGQHVPSIGMVETYVRLLLVVPQTLFRHHVNGMMQRYQQGLAKPGVSLLLLEILNYRLIPLYRYQNKIKQLLFDIAKILITVKTKRGEHRLFRLAENLGINLILSMRDVFLIKKELKGASTEFTETLNRVMVINLAITMKTRGIQDFDQLVILQPALEQILANSQHTWSEKTMRHFPPTLRDVLSGRPDKRQQMIQQWQAAEATVMHTLRAVLSPAHDLAYAMTTLNAMNFSQHRQYLCAGALMLMDGHLESINTANLGRLIKELSPEEVTTNIYTMVDVLLHNIQMQLQHGHLAHDLLLRASAGLAVLMWTQEILPFDITLLALADRDDDTNALRLVIGLLLDRPEFLQRMQHQCVSRGQQEHWMQPGPFQRLDPQQALGQHLAGKDRYPIFFDEMSLRALPVIPLIIYRLIENDATDTAERLLFSYQRLLLHHPAQFSFVRDTLAYFYGSLPTKLIVGLLRGLDLNKIPFSEAFLQHVGGQNPGNILPHEYYHNLLQGLVNKVIPPSSKSRTSAAGPDGLPGLARSGSNRSQAPGSGNATGAAEVHKVFYQHIDPGTYSQLVLETAVVELLSLPPPSTQVVTMLVNAAVRVPSPPAHSTGSGGLVNPCLSTVGTPRSPLLPTSPTNAGDNQNAASNTGAASNSVNLLTSCPLVIQACGLLLAQLPTAFHGGFYSETARIIKECWWVSDTTRAPKEMDAVFGHTVWDPTWAVQDEMSSVVGNTLALLHAFSANLPFDWLEGMHSVITLQRPISSVAHLRLAFRIMGPLLPRLVISRTLFAKTLALLFTVMADVFGRNSVVSANCEAAEISDLVDFLHHAVMMETQGISSAVGKPRPETLMLCSKAVERLRPDLQHLFRHLSADVNTSIYAATHPKMAQLQQQAQQALQAHQRPPQSTMLTVI
ncbi:mediator of RNA polymerase II transcription subunit 23 [Marchantia polymorpha subsp. ruderalis]